jgi:hypothetical protein
MRGVRQVRKVSRRSRLALAGVVCAVAMLTWVAGALADAGNPILGTIKASLHDNGDGTVTIFVRGQWNWLSHNNDCNFDRAATGVGIIWNDPTEPGFTVTKGSISAGVGVASVRSTDTYNTVDEMVHPVDLGNIPEGYTRGTFKSTAQGYTTNADGDYPSGQQFVDPSPPAPSTANVALWKGGCGREALTDTASPNPDTNTATSESTGRSCATTPASVVCSGHPWGSWGYTKVTTIGANTFIGYKHTYEKIQSSGPNAGQSGLPSSVCVNFYDVHGGGKATSTLQAPKQTPNGTKEIDVNGNGDNSIQTNAFNVNDTSQGGNCITIAQPTLVTVATDNKVGFPIHDTATISGLPANTGGTLTFRAFGPRDPSVNATPDCSGTPAFGPVDVTVNAGNGSYGSGDFTPTLAGTYDWQVHYEPPTGGLVLPADSVCGDVTAPDDEQSDVSKQTPGLTTDARIGGNSTVLLKNLTANDLTDTATLTKPTGGVNSITGTLTYHLYRGTTCVVANEVSGSPVQKAVNGFGSYTSPAINVTLQGLYRWTATFVSSDGTNTGVAGSCGDTNEDLKVINPSIRVTKTPRNQTVPTGGTATWTITVTNNSDDTSINPGATLAAQRGGLSNADLTLTNVHTTDAEAANCAKTAAQIALIPPHSSSTFAPGDTVSYTCSRANVTVAFDNVIVACGTALTTDDVCDNNPADADHRTGSVGLEDLTSLQNVTPNDAAKLNGFTDTPNGSMTFNLYRGDCVNANRILGPIVVGVDANGNATTSNATDLITLLKNAFGANNFTTTDGTYNWRVTYTGDTHGNSDISPGTCGSEHFSIVNDGHFANP